MSPPPQILSTLPDDGIEHERFLTDKEHFKTTHNNKSECVRKYIVWDLTCPTKAATLH